MYEDKKRVLIVDDMPENIQILVNSLKDSFTVVAATNGEKALDIVSKEPVDLVILDIIMPDMSGYEVCEALKNKESTKEIPVIFISILDDIDAIVKGFDLGIVDYIAKPFNVEEVTSRVKTHLALAEQKKDLKERLLREKRERQIREKQLIQREKMAAMGEMLALITHQWRQPLHTVNSITSDIIIKKELRKPLNDEQLIQSMRRVEENISYLSDTINVFGNFFKADKVRQNIYLHDVVEKASDLLEESAKLSHVLIDYSHCSFQESVSIYENELLQVFLNIIKNSIDEFQRRETLSAQITITSEENTSFQKVIIDDNGGGIAPEILEHIFDANFTTKEDDGGSGLGLYMSKVIIEEHCNGKISANNHADGARFIIEIPKEVGEPV